jgi:dihydroorotate dehydrogenase (NAD+) catalytic subunit
MIELAPNHKRGLGLKGPIIPATGIMGYSDAYRRLIPLEILGALITNPITAHPRRGAIPPRVVGTTGGMLMHTGLHNPGVATVLRHHQKRWQHSPIPVIAHVVGVNLEETLICIERLSELEAIAGIELGLPDSLPIAEAVEIVEAVYQACLLPLIVKLPLWKAIDLADHILRLGIADVLTVGAPPRGAVLHKDRIITGRLYGPVTFPQALWMLRQVSELVNGTLPIIGCGGVHSSGDVRAMLNAGAVAVQVDSYIWKDPAGFVRLVQRTTEAQGEEKGSQLEN